jgi:hypothetical protein
MRTCRRLDVVLKKAVRTDDGVNAGIVVRVSDAGSMVIQDNTLKKEFIVPKGAAEGIDDISEIYLILTQEEEELVSRYGRKI